MEIFSPIIGSEFDVDSFTSGRAHVRCLAHITNLAVKVFFEGFAPAKETRTDYLESLVTTLMEGREVDDTEAEKSRLFHIIKIASLQLSGTLHKVRQFAIRTKHGKGRTHFMRSLRQEWDIQGVGGANLASKISLDCVTRWNSTYKMLHEYRYFKETICKLFYFGGD
jgi:hypothetical protein